MTETKSKADYAELDAACNEHRGPISTETHFTLPDPFAVRSIVDHPPKDTPMAMKPKPKPAMKPGKGKKC